MVTGIQINVEQLVSECIAGNRQSQEMFYNFFAPKMFGICLRYSSDYHNAEDLLQDGFIKAFNNLHKFRHEGSFEGWLKRIFVNTAIEAFRKSKHLRQFTDLDDLKTYTLNPLALQNLAQEELLFLIQKLPSGYRTVFNLYAIEGYTHKEIGAILKISEGTSKSQLARGRATLQKMIRANAKEFRLQEQQSNE